MQVILKYNNDDIDCLRHKISVSNNVICIIESETYSTYTTVPAPYFLQGVIEIYLSHRCSPQINPEIEIVFLSDLKDNNGKHYLDLPKSMLCRKLTRKFLESQQDFEYN